MLQKLEMLIMVLRVFKIWGIIPAYTKELDTIDNLKLLLKNGNQDLVRVGYAESIYKI